MAPATMTVVNLITTVLGDTKEGLWHDAAEGEVETIVDVDVES